MQQQTTRYGDQFVTTPPKRKHLDRKPGYIYFRDPRTSKRTPLPLDETSDEFATQYDALLAALRGTSEMDLVFGANG
jgi:hypothetical protein